MKQLLFRFLTSGAAAAATAEPSGSMGQGELFPLDAPAKKQRFPLGAIVRERVPYNRHLYFQVRQVKTVLEMMRMNIKATDPKKIEKQLAVMIADHNALKAKTKEHGYIWRDLDDFQYYMEPVPYGFTIDTMMGWHDETNLVDTGLRWRVPSNEQLDQWSIKAHPYNEKANVLGAHRDGGFNRWFLGTYHTPINGTGKPRPEKLEYWHYDNKPFPEERELVKLLESLDPKLYPRWDERLSDVERFEKLYNRCIKEEDTP